jgi:hypothetical protein
MPATFRAHLTLLGFIIPIVLEEECVPWSSPLPNFWSLLTFHPFSPIYSPQHSVLKPSVSLCSFLHSPISQVASVHRDADNHTSNGILTGFNFNRREKIISLDISFRTHSFTSVMLPAWGLTYRQGYIRPNVHHYSTASVRRPGFDSRHYQKKKYWVWNGVHSASWVQLRSYLIEK